MDARFKFLIASIVLFVILLVTSLPWKAIGMTEGNPFLIAWVLADSASSGMVYILIVVAIPFLLISWGMAAAGAGGLTLIFGSIPVMAALVIIIAAAAAPNAATLSDGELLDYLLLLGSPAAACLAGLSCVSRVSNRG